MMDVMRTASLLTSFLLVGLTGCGDSSGATASGSGGAGGGATTGTSVGVGTPASSSAVGAGPSGPGGGDGDGGAGGGGPGDGGSGGDDAASSSASAGGGGEGGAPECPPFEGKIPGVGLNLQLGNIAVFFAPATGQPYHANEIDISARPWGCSGNEP
jgi:hypothetical protein